MDKRDSASDKSQRIHNPKSGGVKWTVKIKDEFD